MTITIPAILILSSKTYGSKGFGNSAKHYYKCYLSDDNPISEVILVLYKPDLKQFSKKLTNKYVLIEKTSETHGKIIIVTTMLLIVTTMSRKTRVFLKLIT